MAKLTRKQKAAIECALYNAKRANTYIMNKRTAIAIRDTQATTTLHYSRASDGAVLYEVAKDIGSDLVGLPQAIEILERMLNADT